MSQHYSALRGTERHRAAQDRTAFGTASSPSISSAVPLPVAQVRCLEARPFLTFLYIFPVSWVAHDGFPSPVSKILRMSRSGASFVRDSRGNPERTPLVSARLSRFVQFRFCPRLDSYCFDSSCLSSSRLGSPRFGPSLLGAFRLGSNSFRSSCLNSSRLGSPRFGPPIVGAFGLSSDSPPFGSSRFGIESDLETELVERPARFDCNFLCASHAFRQVELKIQITSVEIRASRTT